MKREVISVTGASSTAPLSPGIRLGNLLFTSGNVGVDHSTGSIPEGIEAQTRACFENLRQILEAAGTSFANVVKANVYLTDMADFGRMNEVYREYFPTAHPARTTVCIKALANPRLIVEIELVALVET